MTLYVFLSLLAIITLTAILFINLHPAFGGKHDKDDIARYEASGNYEGGIFQNQIETNMDMGFTDMRKTIYSFIKGSPRRNPSKPIPFLDADSTSIANYEGEDRLMWFGHSSFILQMDGKTILLDPMLGPSPAPHPWLGGKRYNKQLPIELDKLPQIDAVIISHDHYDHLDYPSIKKLRGKTSHFYVPLGVGTHIEKWGVPKENITEFNWWDEHSIGTIEIAFTPSRHFSGRGLTDRSRTLWGSWVIKSTQNNLFFSGDSGYGPHFKKIGQKYGPFDLGLMECGQYNEKWAAIHMMPEETALAGVDIQANSVMPIHWGAFTLALHDWDDPIMRVIPAAKDLEIPLVVPQIGEFISISEPKTSSSDWWTSVD